MNQVSRSTQPYKFKFENEFESIEGVATSVEIYYSEDDDDSIESIPPQGSYSLRAELDINDEGYAYQITRKRLTVTKTASINVDVPPSVVEILAIKRRLGLPPAAVGKYRASKESVVFTWKEEV